MLLIIKTGDETGHSVALNLEFLETSDGATVDDLLSTAIVVTGERDPEGKQPWVEVLGVRPSFEIAHNTDVKLEAF